MAGQLRHNHDPVFSSTAQDPKTEQFGLGELNLPGEERIDIISVHPEYVVALPN
jgi:hypothetical protein